MLISDIRVLNVKNIFILKTLVSKLAIQTST